MVDFKCLSFMLILFLAYSQRVVGQNGNVLSTGYVCARTYAFLECPADYMIIVSSITYKYTPSQCADYVTEKEFGGKGTSSIDHCIGFDNNDKQSADACNGQQACHYLMPKKSQKLGHYGTNCDFMSNIADINYVCIPNRRLDSFRAFDICDPDGPDTIIGLTSGFIHSPSYPDYYGNNKFCYLNLGVPEGQRLVIYLLTKSMEGLGIFKKPNDYLIIDNEYEIYGTSTRPYILFNSTSKESVQIKFKSDWITSTPLTHPKGFSIYFELTSDVIVPPTSMPFIKLTTTEQLTNTSVLEISQKTVNETFLNTNESLREELIFRQNLISQKMRQDIETRKQENDQIVTIVSTLVALIGILVLTIFGLLLLFRNRQSQQTDDIYHDVSDQKSISETIYGEQYQNSSDLGSPSSPKKKSSKFNARLQKFYKQLNENLSLSNKINKTCKTGGGGHNSTSLNNTPTKTYSINEFNPNDVDIKFERDTPIDKLKLFKISTTSSRSAANLFKKTILEHEKEQQLNRLENTYVSNPMEMNSQNSTKKLQIYEVNFDNDIAYISPSIESKSSTSILMSPPPLPGLSTPDNNNTTTNNQTEEIYQTISDIENDQHQASQIGTLLNELIENDQHYHQHESINESITNEHNGFNDETIDSTKDMIDQSIYNVPTNNKKVVSTVVAPKHQNDENMLVNQNSSITRLLNETDTEAHA